MDFKPGDKLLCIDGVIRTGESSLVRTGEIYICKTIPMSPHSGLVELQGQRLAWSKTRFILANDFSKLEYIIYGVIE